MATDVVRGSVTDSNSLNRYPYVQNNPVLFVDPDGRKLKLPDSYEYNEHTFENTKEYKDLVLDLLYELSGRAYKLDTEGYVEEFYDPNKPIVNNPMGHALVDAVLSLEEGVIVVDSIMLQAYRDVPLIEFNAKFGDTYYHPLIVTNEEGGFDFLEEFHVEASFSLAHELIHMLYKYNDKGSLSLFDEAPEFGMYKNPGYLQDHDISNFNRNNPCLDGRYEDLLTIGINIYEQEFIDEQTQRVITENGIRKEQYKRLRLVHI